MCKIKMKKIISIMFSILFFGSFSVNQHKFFAMDDEQAKKQQFTPDYDKYFGEKGFMDGYDLNDSYSSSGFSNSSKKIIRGTSGKYTIEIDKKKNSTNIFRNEENFEKKKNVQDVKNKNTNSKIVAKNINKSLNNSSTNFLTTTNKDNKNTASKPILSNLNKKNRVSNNEVVYEEISTSRVKDDAKTVRDNRVAEQRAKTNGNNFDFNVEGIPLTKEELEYNMKFFNVKNVPDTVNVSKRKHFNHDRSYYEKDMSEFKENMFEQILKHRDYYHHMFKKYLEVFLNDKDSEVKMQSLFSMEDFLPHEYGILIMKILRLFKVREILEFCSDKNIKISEYCSKNFTRLYSKYKKKIYNKPEILGFSIDEIFKNLILEISGMIYHDMLFDDGLFYYKRLKRTGAVEGYDLISIVNKFNNKYLNYKEKVTGIRFIVMPESDEYKNIIFIKNPSRYILNLAQRLSGVDVKITKGGLQITAKEITKKLLDDLLPIVVSKYCNNSKDILFIIKDCYANEKLFEDSIDVKPEVAENDRDYPYFYKRVLNLIRDYMFKNVNDDRAFTEYEKEKKFENLNKEQEKYDEKCEEEFFNYGEGKSRYVITLTFPLQCLAKEKDIFNIDENKMRLMFNSNPGFLNTFKIKEVDVVPQNMDDCFTLKFYIDKYDDETVTHVRNYSLFVLNKMSNAMVEQKKVNNINGLCAYNKIICEYLKYLNSKEKRLKFLKEHPYENSVKNKFATSNRTYCDDSLAVGFLDWSRKYRGTIPVENLIVKSFYKENDPFSEFYFDIADGHIQDYVLRVYENILNSVEIFSNVISSAYNDDEKTVVKVYKNPNIR